MKIEKGGLALLACTSRFCFERVCQIMSHWSATTAAVTILLLLTINVQDGVAKVLNFSLIVSFGLNGYNSSGAIPGIDLAVERIAEREVLPDYRLQYSEVQDSEVSFEGH